jgi:antitoxin component YwqK of YwqJK toxin-antitoxin module
LHGSWKQFDEQGAVIAEGNYANHRKEGPWRRTYRGDDAPLLATAPYKDFTAPFVSEATFKHGQLDGKWTIVDSLQRKVHEIEFQAGERNGIAAFYYPTGSILLQSPFEHGLVNGDVLDYSPEGQIIGKEHFEAGRKLSQKTEFHDDKQQVKKSESMYLHAMLAARTSDNWDTGELAVFEVRGEDEKHGPFTTWHPNGQIARQGEFRYNLPVGKFTFWYPNGQKQMEGNYTDGQQQGTWIWWHENGQKSIAGDYKDGQPVGSWSWWKSTGKLAQKNDFTPKAATPIASPSATPAPATAIERTARPPVNALPGTLQR